MIHGMRKAMFVLTVAVFAVAVGGCKPRVPREYIQPDDMEDILYDWYVAQIMAEDGHKGGDRDYAMHAYKLQVLQKHGVSEADFDTALVYYTRHADRLNTMYKNIEDRLAEQAIALGADAREISHYGANVAEGDTANIWPGERSLVLSQQAPYNHFSFSIEADTSFHKGDRVILSLDSRFIVQQGSHTGTAMLAIVFDNDSIASRTTQMRKNSHYSVELTDNDSAGIREVKGFICINDDEKVSSSTMRMMFAENIRLVKMKKGARKPAQSSSLPDDNGRNSHARRDSLATEKQTKAPLKPHNNIEKNDSAVKPIRKSK